MSRRFGQIVALLSVLVLLVAVVSYQFYYGQNLKGDVLDAGYEGTQVCGNGSIEAGEQCDDGNVMAGDGCSELCVQEVKEPEVVSEDPSLLCGNGAIDEKETCDDANKMKGDGCNDLCQIETLSVCGNGTIEENETCDDGNTRDADGCSATCSIEMTLSPEVKNQDNATDPVEMTDTPAVTNTETPTESPVETPADTPVETPTDVVVPEVTAPVYDDTYIETQPIVSTGPDGLIVHQYLTTFGANTVLDGLQLPQYVPNFRTKVRWTLESSTSVEVQDVNASKTYFTAPSQETDVKFLLELNQNDSFLPIAHYVFTVVNPAAYAADANKDGKYNFEDLVNLLQHWDTFGPNATQVLAIILSRYQAQ